MNLGRVPSPVSSTARRKMAVLSREFEISHKTPYKIFNRHRDVALGLSRQGRLDR